MQTNRKSEKGEAFIWTLKTAGNQERMFSKTPTVVHNFLSMFLFWVKMVGVGVGKGGKDLHAILFIKDSQFLKLIFVSLLHFILLYREGMTYQEGW